MSHTSNTGTGTGTDVDVEARHSRRLALKLAGAGLVGAVAASAIADAAAADDGITLTAGTPTTTTSPVRTVFQGAAGNVGYLFESGVSGDSNASTFPAVVGAWARPTGTPIHGMYAFTAKPNGMGLVAESTGTAGIGVDARGTNTGMRSVGTETGLDATGGLIGVKARATLLGGIAVDASKAVSGVVVRATSEAASSVAVWGVAQQPNSVAIEGRAQEAGSVALRGEALGADSIGVFGIGPAIGGKFDSRAGTAGVGVFTEGGRYGASISGGEAHVYLVPTGAAPSERTRAHQVGELVVDAVGDAWLCVGAGTPGTWRKLAGPSTAGAFHAIEPARVYDSRLSMAPTPNGSLATGQTRVIPVKDRRNVTTGVVDATGVVPSGATAIAYNVTVVNTAGAGYVYVAPGSATAITASTANWHETTRGAIANAAIVAIDTTRSVKLFVGGAPPASAQVIVDVTGYYR